MGKYFDAQPEGLPIGLMAKLNQVSERTLRVYHQKGILIPSHIDEATGFRYYDLYQCSTLDMIQQLKELGFSLDEIKRIVDANDVEALENSVIEHLSTIETELDRLAHAKKMGETLVSNCRHYKSHPPFGKLHYEKLPERRVIRLARIEAAEEPSIDEAIANWERTLRTCKKLMLDGSFPATLFRNISDTMTANSLRGDEPRYGEAVAFVDESYRELFESAEIVPEGLFAVMFCDTFSDEDGNYIEPRLVRQMVQHVREDGYEVNGEYIGEVVAETPLFYERRHNMLTKMQIPVRPR